MRRCAPRSVAFGKHCGARQRQGRVPHRANDDSRQRRDPLKFSLDDDDALATLQGRAGGRDDAGGGYCRSLHRLANARTATVSAMQAAVRVLLAQFAPEAVERKIATNALHIHPAQKKAKAWEAFVQQHKSITQALSDDFDSVFGKAFARAYEEAIDKLTTDGPPSDRPLS